VVANQGGQDYVAAASLDTVWVEDAPPTGAILVGTNENWNWVTSNPAPYSGSLAHQSGLVTGLHQHYFYNATATLSVGAGDTLFAYVYLDPANPPSGIMLQWNDGTWEHRAYWGANFSPWGTDGTVSLRNMGALPPTGQWVRLQVSAAQVGLQGSTLNGMAFTLYNGRATWDLVGKGSGTPPRPPTVSLQSVATGFSSPVDIANAHDGSGRLFVVQQGGQIKILSAGQVLPTPFLNIASLIVAGGEQGLLGLAFHPNYASNGFFYVNYTRQGDGATVIARYTRSAADPNVADTDPASQSILLTIQQPFANHNGGQIRFGPDGYLYIGMGDGGSGNDPGNRAQNLGTLLGKMLRIDVNSGSPYAIPPSNPFNNEIWAYGLRNPWRFSFDRLTGDLFIADVGQSAWEEISFQAAGNGAGANYGWRVMEGAHCTGLDGGPPCFDPSFVLPILEYSHDWGCSITGGFRYRGAAYPALAGYLLFGDYCSGRVWGAKQYSNGLWTVAQFLTTGSNISTFGEDETGELYLATYNTGTIYRISTTP
jgi:glucose/arabinose dehydrogenase